MKNYPKVSFGMVNCNRLFYLKSCLESLLECTQDYPNKEIIIVDNASAEKGTKEYLDSIKDENIKIHITKERDPSNEYARGLNTIYELSDGDYIIPLEGDLQFIVKNGWLKEYVDFFENNKESTGSISLDAQRTIRLNNGRYLFPKNQSKYKFIYNLANHPISGAGDAVYSREILDKMYPWVTENSSHEGGGDCETKMLAKINKILGDKRSSTFLAVPIFPVCTAIYTDPRGTNARIRGNKGYGEYWPPKESFKYYEIHEYEDALKLISDRDVPLGIESVANPIGWDKPLDNQGNWLKNPIRPENCTEDDYEVIH